MGKGLHKLLEQCKHPSGRKTLALIKKTKKIKKREHVKIANAVKMNAVGRTLFWFYEAIEERENTDEPLTPKEFLDLIELYLHRFDEELEQIKIKQNIGKKRNNAHASREAVIKITLGKEIENFNGGGLELPNLCDKEEYTNFMAWDGDSAKIQHLKMHFISKSKLKQQIDATSASNASISTSSDANKMKD